MQIGGGMNKWSYRDLLWLLGYGIFIAILLGLTFWAKNPKLSSTINMTLPAVVENLKGEPQPIRVKPRLIVEKLVVEQPVIEAPIAEERVVKEQPIAQTQCIASVETTAEIVANLEKVKAIVQEMQAMLDAAKKEQNYQRISYVSDEEWKILQEGDAIAHTRYIGQKMWEGIERKR